MATSGTYSTVYSNQQLIDNAHRHARVAAELITGEKIDIALDLLHVILQEMASMGVPVWKIEKQLIPLYQGQGQISPLPSTIRVLDVNLRSMQRLTGTPNVNSGNTGTAANAFDGNPLTACTEILAAGTLEVNFTTPVIISTVGLLPNVAGTWDFVYEVSLDSVTWITFATFTAQAVAARQWVWNDYAITRYPAYQYARIRALNTTVLDVAELYFSGAPSAIPMVPINKDEYFYLPNKAFQGRPVQFWQDLTRDSPVLNLWPVPNADANFQLAEMLVQRAIQDVGSLTQTIDIPVRALRAVEWALAEDIVANDPDSKADLSYVQSKARGAVMLAMAGLRPQGSTRFNLNISGYTR